MSEPGIALEPVASGASTTPGTPGKGAKESKKDKLAKLKEERKMDEHVIPLPELEIKLQTNFEHGLSDQEALERLKRNGPNALTPPKQTPEIIKFLKQMVTGFSTLLWVAAVLCIVIYLADPAHDLSNVYLAVVLAIVVIVTGTFSYYQEGKSAKVMEGFRKMVPTISRVKRDGAFKDLDASQLVVGDIVEISLGNKIPADLRILHSMNLKVDNSSLTGESEPLLRTQEHSDPNPLESPNLAFFSTPAVEGTAIGVVLFTGDHTIIGTIAGLASGTGKGETPIHRELNRFVLRISFIAVIVGVILFFAGLAIYPIITNIILAVGIIVANVPEGLLATVTVSLTHAAREMAKRNVLVKNLEAVETLGSTSTICSDKTGTLTQNRMTVIHMWYDNAIKSSDLTITHGKYRSEDPTFDALMKVAVLGSRTTFKAEIPGVPVNQWETAGDATESALIKFFHPIKNINRQREECPKIFEIPFNSRNKFALSIHANKNGAGPLLVMKGAPERVIDRCSHILIDGRLEPLSEDWLGRMNEAYEALGGLGERVLGFAIHTLDPQEFPEGYAYQPDPVNFPDRGLTFAGLISLIDPPREAVPAAIHSCKTAGIKVIMVTGDHPITAKAIAQKVGIIPYEFPILEDLAKQRGVPPSEISPEEVKSIVVNGQQLLDYTDDDWHRTLSHRYIVFARTSPQQKLKIVESCQKRGECVAVTGDGVNDSPALKQADIGVAMGISGSDVSKEAADMILLDDNFASIVAGIEQGRIIFDNLKKSIAYTLEHLVPEVMPFVIFVIFQTPQPLTTVLILCIDLGTDLLPAVSLAYEVAESDIMKRPPRNPKTDNLVTGKLFCFAYLQIGIMQFLGAWFTFLVVLGDYGFKPSDVFGVPDWSVKSWHYEKYDADYSVREKALRNAQTAVFVSIVVVQWGGIFVCKTRKLSLVQQGAFKNSMMNFSLMLEVAIVVLLLYVPPFHGIFGTEPLAFKHWLPSLPFSVMLVLYDETRKWWMRNHPGGWVERFTYY